MAAEIFWIFMMIAKCMLISALVGWAVLILCWKIRPKWYVHRTCRFGTVETELQSPEIAMTIVVWPIALACLFISFLFDSTSFIRKAATKATLTAVGSKDILEQIQPETKKKDGLPIPHGGSK